MALTVVTWNLKGSEQPDTVVVVEHARAVGADVLLLQEVQRRQARAVARGLGAASLRWGFKHWPLVTWPEGMAVVGVSRRAVVRARALTNRWWLWSWRRRILLTGVLEGRPADDGDGPPSDPAAGPVRLVNLHLSPGRAASRRAREVAAVLDIVAATAAPRPTVSDGPTEAAGTSAADVPTRSTGAGSTGRSGTFGGGSDDGETRDGAHGGDDRRPDVPLVVAGDLNAGPAAALFGRFAAAGLHDAWEMAHPGRPEQEGATNWSGDRRGPPRRRIDHVLVSPGVGVVSASVPRPGDERFEQFRALSDHLPVTVALDP